MTQAKGPVKWQPVVIEVFKPLEMAAFCLFKGEIYANWLSHCKRNGRKMGN